MEIGPSRSPTRRRPRSSATCGCRATRRCITAGQGGDRPIDASLGDAVPLGAAARPCRSCPIDSVPVVQFLTAPTVSSALTTFTQPLAAAPTLPPGGWVQLGGNRKVTYELTAIILSGGSPLFTAGVGAPKATWRPDPATSSASGTAAVDLALFSNVPLMGARALERSTDLTAIVDGVFGGVCTPTAPPAAVLWTFCRQPLGPSGVGWELHGDAWPDPPGTAPEHAGRRRPARRRAGAGPARRPARRGARPHLRRRLAAGEGHRAGRADRRRRAARGPDGAGGADPAAGGLRRPRPEC